MNFNENLMKFGEILWKFNEILILGDGSAWFCTLNKNPASKPAQTRLKTRFLSKIRFFIKIGIRRTGRSLLNITGGWSQGTPGSPGALDSR